MSTGRMNIQARRFLILSQMEEKVFHASDLANIWLIKDKNTLHTTLRRYVRAGLLYRLYRGFYSLLPPEKLDPLLIGVKAIHSYCYVSAETILFNEGYISQPPGFISLISSKSLSFRIGTQTYKSRQLKDNFLFCASGIACRSNINMALTERAIADMLYFNPKFHFDRKVDWIKIRELQKNIGYPLTPSRYDFTKSQR